MVAVDFIIDNLDIMNHEKRILEEKKRKKYELVVLVSTDFIKSNSPLHISEALYQKVFSFVKSSEIAKSNPEHAISFQCYEYIKQRIIDDMPWLDFNDNLTFGKHNGLSLREAISKDASWVVWAINNNLIKVYDEVVVSAKSNDSIQQSEKRIKRPCSYSRGYNRHSNWSMQDDSDFASAFDWGCQ